MQGTINTSAKPKPLNLLKQAHLLLWANRALAVRFILPMMIPVMILAAPEYLPWKDEGGKYFRLITSMGGFGYISFVFYACFALAWHRVCLLGPSAEWAVSPLRLKQEDKKPLLMIYGFMVAPSVVIFLYTVGIVFMEGVYSYMLTGLFLILSACLLILLFNIFLVLPAHAIGAPISFRQSIKLSKEVSWTLFFSFLFLGCFSAAAIDAWGSIVKAVAGLFMGPEVPLYMPLHWLLVGGFSALVSFYVLAISIGVLSCLYQWALKKQGGV